MVQTKKEHKPTFSPQRKKIKMITNINSRTIKPSMSGTTDSTSANMKVAIRVRPPNQRELAANLKTVVKTIDSQMLIFDPKEDEEPFFHMGVQQPTYNHIKKTNKEMQFMFDNVFNMSSTNDDVFNDSVHDILNSLMDGYNCSVFVYGATGAGKTHTMLGHGSHPGITYLTMQELFNNMDMLREEKEFDICVSYLEIYNENVYDLLSPSGPLNLRDDGKYGVVVAGLYSKSINTARELLDMLDQGNKNRTQHPTDANSESSRSHAVFQVYVKMRPKTLGQVKIVKLSMIDLAGSERASATGCKGERFKEGANINRSLLALGNCINQLADGSKFIPYRDSKLTRLLKDSLGGNCRTVMIANIAPTSASFEDTYNTLKYATRANKIQLRMRKNIVSCDNHVSQYIKRAEELSNRVKVLEAELAQAKAAQSNHSSEFDEISNKLAREWRSKVEARARPHAAVLKGFLFKQARQRRLAARAARKRRAAVTVSSLSCDIANHELQKDCRQDTTRLEMSSEALIRQAEGMKEEIRELLSQLQISECDLKLVTDQAMTGCPSLEPVISAINSERSLIIAQAREQHLHAITNMQHEEINDMLDFNKKVLKMLKKYYLFLKGDGKVTKSMTEEYNGLIRQAKNSRAVTWEDVQETIESEDAHFQFIVSLDPGSTLDMPDLPKIDIQQQDDELTYSPCVFQEVNMISTNATIHNETVVLLDSEDDMNSTHTIEPESKPYVIFPKDSISNKNFMRPLNNAKPLNTNNLNSTFVLSNKAEQEPILKKAFTVSVDHKTVLSERTNFISSDSKLSAQKNKPSTGKGTPFKRMISATTVSKENKSGFGSSAGRFHYGMGSTTNNFQVGCKAVRGKERGALASVGPYSRPNATSTFRR